MDYEARIVKVLTKKYGVDPARISPDASLADLGLDSLTLAELIFDIEDEFGIEVSTEDAHLATFGDAVGMVTRLCEAKQA